MSAPPKQDDAPRAVILYSLPPDDLGRRKQLRALADRLNAEGVDTEIAFYHAAPPEGWQVWMERVTETRTLLVVWTEQSRARFDLTDAGGEGGAQYESRLIRQRLNGGRGFNRDVLPIVLAPDDAQYVPTVLGDVTRYDVSVEQQYEKLYAVLTGRELYEKPAVGDIRPLRYTEQVTLGASARIVNPNESVEAVRSPDDLATRAQIAAALERQLEAMRRVFIHGAFPLDAWQQFHNDLNALVRSHAGARALGDHYGAFCKALDHDQFCINYTRGLRAEFDEKAKTFARRGERYEKQETRYYDAHVEQAVADDVQSLAPFLREFGQDALADQLEYMAVSSREIAERVMSELPRYD